MANQIRIDNFQKGVAPSCYLGFQEIRGLNIIDKPGVIYPNYALSKESSTTVDALIRDMWIDPITGIVYGYTPAKVFKRATNGTWSAVTGHGSTETYSFIGMFVWRGFSASGSYIFFIHSDGNVDVYDPTTGQGWTNNWKNAWIDVGGSTFAKPTLIGSDDKVYIGNGTGDYGIYSIAEVAGQTFDPDDSGTYTLTTPALDLPKLNKTKCLAELYGNLLAGTYISYDDTKATIFPWDKSAASYLTPLELGVDTVWRMVAKNNLVYANAGKSGEIFVTNGTTTQILTKMPETMVSGALASPDSLFSYSANGLVFNGMELLFAWHGATSGTNCNWGIYSINVATGAIAMKHTISTGKFGDAEEIYIGAILPLSYNSYLVSWYDATSGGTYGVDKVGTARYLTDEAFFITQFYQIGTRNHKATIQGLNINLTKALSTNDSVKVYYRTTQTGSWTLLHTMSTGQSDYTPAIQSVENIQFKVILNNTAELLSITGDYINQ
jgi:hypothetical protein